MPDIEAGLSARCRIELLFVGCGWSFVQRHFDVILISLSCMNFILPKHQKCRLTEKFVLNISFIFNQIDLLIYYLVVCAVSFLLPFAL